MPKTLTFTEAARLPPMFKLVNGVWIEYTDTQAQKPCGMCIVSNAMCQIVPVKRVVEAYNSISVRTLAMEVFPELARENLARPAIDGSLMIDVVTCAFDHDGRIDYALAQYAKAIEISDREEAKREAANSGT